MTEETLRIALILLVAFVITGLEKRKARQRNRLPTSQPAGTTRYTLLNRRKSQAKRMPLVSKRLPNEQIPQSFGETSIVLK